MMPYRARRVEAVEAYPLVPLPDIERGGLGRGLDQSAQFGPEMLAEIEAAPIERAQPPQARTQPVETAGLARQIAEPLQGRREPKDRALVEAGLLGQRGQRQRLLPLPERLQEGERPLHRFDPILAHRYSQPRSRPEDPIPSFCRQEFCSVQQNERLTAPRRSAIRIIVLGYRTHGG